MELIVFLIFGSVVTLVLALASLPNRRTVKKRLTRLAGGSTATVEAPVADRGATGGSQPRWLERVVTTLAGNAAREGAASGHPIRRRLVQSGYRKNSAFAVFMGSRIALALALPFALLMSSYAWSLDEIELAIMLCGSAGLGYVAPSYWIDKKRAARQLQIIRGLPDGLDLMVICVEAGLGINASLARISKEFSRSHPILSAEFELVTLEVRAGKSTTEALRALAYRTGVTEVSSLVAMLVQTERFGTSVADTLRIHADGMRVQRVQRAEELAAKAPLKMLFPTLIIFAATLLVTLGPGLLQLTEFFAESRQ